MPKLQLQKRLKRKSTLLEKFYDKKLPTPKRRYNAGECHECGISILLCKHDLTPPLIRYLKKMNALHLKESLKYWKVYNTGPLPEARKMNDFKKRLEGK